jgi:hypothetical protein
MQLRSAVHDLLPLIIDAVGDSSSPAKRMVAVSLEYLQCSFDSIQLFCRALVP